MKKYIPLVALMALALTGCGSGSDSAPSGLSSATGSSSATSATATDSSAASSDSASPSSSEATATPQATPSNATPSPSGGLRLPETTVTPDIFSTPPAASPTETPVGANPEINAPVPTSTVTP
ncbi:MAG: hypothetical protein Q3974_02710 [Rothia sp. (in: high G+C Gram-positive bacteria)]|nr:hypothetical protein [Rothia sp. (in: high G+C Gram-positive bacteria)]